MNVIDNTTEPTDSDLVAEVTNYGTSTPQPSHAIAPEDQHYVDAIYAMDQIRDVPGAVVVPEGLKFSAPTLDALDPEGRKIVQAKMAEARLTPAQQKERESEFVEAHVRSKLASIRVKTGLGEDATPYHREQCFMAREYTDLIAEYKRYEEMIEEVAGYRTELDPKTNEPRPVPVFAVQGQRRAAYNAHMDDIIRRAGLLFNDDGSVGIEGQKRLQAALSETVGILKARDEAAAERTEAKRRATELSREERINKQAESLARISRNDF